MKKMQVTIGRAMNPKIVNHEFTLLVDYIKYKLLEQNTKKLEQQWAHEHMEKMTKYVEE